MRFEAVLDAAEFLDRAGALLVDEARHNLILGIAGTLVRSPEVYPEFDLYLVSAEGRPVAAALRTYPYNLVLADTIGISALEELVSGLIAASVSFPGVVGNQPSVDDFVDLWGRNTGDTFRLAMAQGVFALETVRETPEASGQARPAGRSDFKLVSEWMREFAAEAIPDEPAEGERMDRMVARRLSDEGPSAFWVWEDAGRPVALSGHGGPTGRGIRVGPVYTPPRYRRRGYATALVAAESRWLLQREYEFCFLYTDLSNPTSNAIYERIGYHRVGESAQYNKV